jgi:phage tail sheath protein FI
MAEYLAPGVYVEEVSFRSKSIEGVATSTTGFAGLTRYGPMRYPGGPAAVEPVLLGSFTEFERRYGGLERLQTDVERIPYTAHAARAFFMNGGRRLYIARVFAPRGAAPNEDWGVASRTIVTPAGNAVWHARWPGAFGNVRVQSLLRRSGNIAAVDGGAVRARGGRTGAIVEIHAGPQSRNNADAFVPGDLAILTVDPNTQAHTFRRGGANVVPAPNDVIQLIELQVLVHVDAERIDTHDALAVHPAQKRYIGRILELEDPEDEGAVVWLEWAPAAAAQNAPIDLVTALVGDADGRLAGGHDGAEPVPGTLLGEPSDPDDVTLKAWGLEALGEVEDIAIVATPDAATLGTDDERRTATGNLIAHAETLRYRIAVVDGPEASSVNEIRAFRGKFDSKYAALYHPWIEILDPLERAAQGAPPRKLVLPPSGFVAGIYARSDVERGVHKAPANEVVRGLTKFEANINFARQQVLNPEGINALRFFEGRGNRVWGARTMSSDPEWKYVNVRRLFIYLEHSIDKGTQWAVFEPNGERLWRNIRQTIEDFLLVSWRDGALLGAKPEEAFFVRCDRTTMTQNDLDNGRMICLIGVAPVKPAEFVIFRIGQWTGDAKSMTPTL